MVYRKLSSEDEQIIYYEWLSGKPLSCIADNYPVVVSTIQRVVKKKRSLDGSKRNCIISGVFKHLDNANNPLELALKSLEKDLDEAIHEKQKDFLFSSLKRLTRNVETLSAIVEKLELEKPNEEKTEQKTE